MDALKLIAAISYITLHKLIKNDTITMIEFEDGGGYKFNYRTVKEGTQFIDLTGKI